MDGLLVALKRLRLDVSSSSTGFDEAEEVLCTEVCLQTAFDTWGRKLGVGFLAISHSHQYHMILGDVGSIALDLVAHVAGSSHCLASGYLAFPFTRGVYLLLV